MVIVRRPFLCLLLLAAHFYIIYAVYNLICTVRSHVREVPPDDVTCQPGTLLTVKPGGNTANNIWEYMSLYAVSKLYPDHEFTPFVPDELKEKVEEIFEDLSIPAASTIPEECRVLQFPRLVQIRDPPATIGNLRKNRHVLLDVYSTRYEEILEYGINNIKKELRFRKSDVEKATRMLQTIKLRFSFDNTSSPTFVGVHYRGGDYVELLTKNYKKLKGIATFRYYNKAMKFFKERYDDVIFVLVSVDIPWLAQNAERFIGNVAVNPYRWSTKVDDLALLSQCNHTIINYGTFGMTGAVMNGGTTIVYDLGLPIDHKGMTAAMGIAQILPNWLMLSD